MKHSLRYISQIEERLFYVLHPFPFLKLNKDIQRLIIKKAAMYSRFDLYQIRLSSSYLNNLLYQILPIKYIFPEHKSYKLNRLCNEIINFNYLIFLEKLWKYNHRVYYLNIIRCINLTKVQIVTNICTLEEFKIGISKSPI